MKIVKKYIKKQTRKDGKEIITIHIVKRYNWFHTETESLCKHPQLGWMLLDEERMPMFTVSPYEFNSTEQAHMFLEKAIETEKTLEEEKKQKVITKTEIITI